MSPASFHQPLAANQRCPALSPRPRPGYIAAVWSSCLGASLMFTRRVLVLSVALVVVVSATAARSYYQLAGAGQTMGEAATKFISSLSAEQRAKAALPYDDKRRIAWHFIPLEGEREREGLKIKEMTP